MDAYLQPLLSLSLSRQSSGRENLVFSDDCHIIDSIKPVVADKHPHY